LAPGVVRDHTSTQRGAELGRLRAALVQVPSVLANDERSAQLDAFAVKRLRINSMLAAAIIRQKSKIKQSRTLRQSIATRVRSIPNSAYVRKLYVPFVFLTNLEQEDDDHRSCLSPIIADIFDHLVGGRGDSDFPLH
jgi:hypothetical protein